MSKRRWSRRGEVTAPDTVDPPVRDAAGDAYRKQER
jgi:hypothetical protein